MLAKEASVEFLKLEEDDKSTPKKAKDTLAILRLVYENGLLLQVRNLIRPQAVWATLEKLDSPKGFSLEFLIFKEFFDTTLASYGN